MSGREVAVFGAWRCHVADDPGVAPTGPRYAFTARDDGSMERLLEFEDRDPPAVMLTTGSREFVLIPVPVVEHVAGSPARDLLRRVLRRHETLVQHGSPGIGGDLADDVRSFLGDDG